MTPVPPLQEELRKEWDRCAAEGEPLALLIVAIDHVTGGGNGEVTTHLERAIRVHCGRDRDRVVPQSAGVFVAILPHTPPPGAHHVGEQIVEAMHHAPLPTATVSVGVAAVVPSETDDPATLLPRAQRALRAAQDQGGNRCLGASTPPPPPKGPLTQLRELLHPPKTDEAHNRRTD
jgi:PleD family two-component response regulator